MRRGDCSCPVQAHWEMSWPDWCRHHLETHTATFPETPDLYLPALLHALHHAEQPPERC